MKKSFWIRAVALLLVLVLTGCNAPPPTTEGSTSSLINTEEEQPFTLTAEQRNSLAMLYYLALTTQQIHSSVDSIAALEEIHTALNNDINPAAVNEETQEFLNTIRGTIDGLMGIGSRRESMQFIYNQRKAYAILEALPALSSSEALGSLLSGSSAAGFDWVGLATAAAITTLDAIKNYALEVNSAEREYLLSVWELDEEERKTVFNSRGNLFNYMVDFVQQCGTEEDRATLGNLTLNEKAIEDFVRICEGSEPRTKIQLLVNAEDTYALFGNYWLELADCYFEIGDYQKCLNCIQKYQDLGITIFRRDFNLLPLLPKAIVAAQNVYTGEEAIAKVQGFADAIMANANTDDWSSRYFAALTYMDLYAKTDNKLYLETAYEIAKSNVSVLAGTQGKLNATYLSGVNTITPTGSEEEKKLIENYNAELQARRETELPPIYEPLMVNCELLFVLAEKLDVRSSEENWIQGILHSDKEVLFLCNPIGNKFSFEPKTYSYAVEFGKENLTIAASALCQGAIVSITVVAGDSTTIFDDVTLQNVERTGSTADSFKAHFSSAKLQEYKWSENAQITITVSYGENYEPTVFIFRVSKYKDNWIFADTVEFERVQ